VLNIKIFPNGKTVSQKIFLKKFSESSLWKKKGRYFKCIFW